MKTASIVSAILSSQSRFTVPVKTRKVAQHSHKTVCCGICEDQGRETVGIRAASAKPERIVSKAGNVYHKYTFNGCHHSATVLVEKGW